MFAYAEPVTVISPGSKTDPYSGEETGEDDWSSGAVTQRDERCGIGSGGSSEPLLDARNAVDSDFDLIFDHDPGITARDRVRVRGLECQVSGQPFAWQSPFTGWKPGTIVRASIREG